MGRPEGHEGSRMGEFEADRCRPAITGIDACTGGPEKQVYYQVLLDKIGQLPSSSLFFFSSQSVQRQTELACKRSFFSN